MKKFIAWLLSAAMLLGLCGAALAAPAQETGEKGSLGQASVSAQAETKQSRLPRMEFPGRNVHSYAEDEQVRAVIFMESAPLTETQYSIGSAGAATYAARLRKEKSNVFSAMRASQVDYQLAYTFDTLVNGFSCDVAYGELETIAALPGVKSVHIANRYSIPTPQEPNMSEAGSITGNAATHTAGYTGQGMVVAVLDSGTNLTHIAFQEYENVLGTPKLTEDDVAAVSGIAAGQYVNAKVPFAYDYADQDNDPTDDGQDTGGHGTHVAGIAVGYAESEDGAVTFTGSAPGAQLLAMKIFGTEKATTTSDIYFKALEDAMKLGADVINMSIGSDNGFTYDESLGSELDNIYKKLENAGIVVCVSAGNSNTMGQYAVKGYISPDYADYGMVGSPATYAGNVAVASMENSAYPQYFLTVGEEKLAYYDSGEGPYSWMECFAGEGPVEYIVIEDEEGGMSIGTAEDFDRYYHPETGESDVEDKIAVVKRGTINFTEKEENAYNNGAIGLIVVNNTNDGALYMVLEGLLPAAGVDMTAETILMNAEEKVIETDEEPILTPSATAGQMSDFSSWGPTPDLTMRPTITSVGGNIWSADWINDEGYQLMSGTSMSSPNLAGTFAAVLQYLYTKDPDMTKTDAAEAAKVLLESSAQVLEDGDYQVYSVRSQGAGLGRSDLARAAWEVGYVIDPIQDELGDSEEGTYTFTVTLRNNTDADLTYTPSAVVLTDSVEDGSVTLQSTTLYDGRNGADAAGGAAVTYQVSGATAESVTVPANGTAQMEVTVALTETGKTYIDNNFPYGSYVEGYVFFAPTIADDGDGAASAAATVHASFLGFYGDWTQAPAMEACDFQDFLDADYLINMYTPADIYGENYADKAWEDFGIYTGVDLLDVTSDVNWAYTTDSYEPYYVSILGNNVLNGFTSALGEELWVPYDESHNVFSTDPEGFNLLFVNPALLRNAKQVDMIVTDAETGEVYYQTSEDTENFNNDDLYIPKASYNSDAGVWENYSWLFWDGTDAEGEFLPDGTQVRVTLNTTLPYKNTLQENSWAIPVINEDNTVTYRNGFTLTMDSTAPEILDVHYENPVEQPGEEPDEEPALGKLVVTARDENLAGLYLYGGEDFVNHYVYDPEVFESNEDGSVTFVFDIEPEDVEIYGVMSVGVVDYAGNETDLDNVPLTENVGDPAVITLHTPKGAQRIKTEVGELYTLPDCDVVTTEEDNAEFAFWYREAIDERIPEEEAEDVLEYEKIVEVGEAKLVTGDADYYAVYMVGERSVLEQPIYIRRINMVDYSGAWAFGANDQDENGYLYMEVLFLLGEDGASLDLTEEDENAELDADMGKTFASAAEGFRFTVKKLSDGSYTIRGVGSGDYLACDGEGNLTTTSATGDSARWTIGMDETGWKLLVSPKADPKLVLLFDFEDKTFKLMDDTVVLGTTSAGEYTASDKYSLFMYQCTESELLNPAYTTALKAKKPSTPIPVTPSEPETKTETTENEDGSTTTTVTTPEGDKTITVTDKDGETVAEVTIPAAIPEPETRFEDVPEGHWADEGIHNMAALKAVNGVGNNQFDMNSGMTRGDLATILHRLSNKPAGGEVSFQDVENDKYYAEGVAWAAKTGVVTGFSKDTYKPEQIITREQMALMLMRYAKLLGMDVTADAAELDVFTDGANTHDWAVEGVAWCVKSGILQGKGGSTLDPTSNVTRAQVAVMLDRFVALMK